MLSSILVLYLSFCSLTFGRCLTVHSCGIAKRYKCTRIVGYKRWLGATLASVGDKTIQLWDVKTGNCVKNLKSEKPYEGMNISDMI